jgi:hypothetical protein
MVFLLAEQEGHQVRQFLHVLMGRMSKLAQMRRVHIQAGRQAFAPVAIMELTSPGLLRATIISQAVFVASLRKLVSLA